jgi:hypothetical protein
MSVVIIHVLLDSMSFLIQPVAGISSTLIVVAEDDSGSIYTRSGASTPSVPDEVTPLDRASLWKTHLRYTSSQSPFPPSSADVRLDEPNQRVIRVDCERTRATVEGFRSPETQEWMEAILTHYCKTHGVHYKQGMNEVLAPFVFLKLTGGVASWAEVYDMYCLFLHRFLRHMISDEEFHFLQRCCVMFRVALRYHAPALSIRLDSASVTPEMYVTPWFLTLFASKTNLTALLLLWDKLLDHGDEYSFVFIALALCLSHARVLRASNIISLPETITKISISVESVTSVWRRSLRIRAYTPVSFLSQLSFISDQKIPDLPAHLARQTGDMYPMFVRPSDLLNRNPDWKYLVLDCRPRWAIESQMGMMPFSVRLDLDDLIGGERVFPVAEAINTVASLLHVNIGGGGSWPIDTHVCVMGLGDTMADTTGLLYVSLVKFGNIPRVSLVNGGFVAVHADVPQELIEHDLRTCPLCSHVPLETLAHQPTSQTSSSEESEEEDSGMHVVIGSAYQKLRSLTDWGAPAQPESAFVMVDAPVTSLPTSNFSFVPNPAAFISKCRLDEILGRIPRRDQDVNVLLILSADKLVCAAAPADLSIVTSACELRTYGFWNITDLVKITTKPAHPETLIMYFSAGGGTDLVITMADPASAKLTVDAIRTRYRNASRNK